ncbi:MAG: M56 family metallopeptidase [Planctomycetia bacterium]|nr:M56 family metallopeptidase [Planctomycetia bacterium]
MNDFAALSQTLIAFVLTYFIHSTVLLAVCWCSLAVTRVKSHFLTERIWKLATILGIVTALTQCVFLPDRLPLVMPWPTEGVTVVDESSQSIFLVESNENTTEDLASLGAASELPLQAAPELPAASGFEMSPINHDPGLVDELQPPYLATIAASTVPEHHVDAATNETVYPLDESILNSPDARFVAEPDETGLTSTLVRATSIWLPVILQVCAVAFVCGFVGGGLLLVVQTTRLHLRFGRAQVLTRGPARSALDRFLKRHQIRRRVCLLASQKHCEPVAYGLFRWTIMLPQGAEDRLNRNELKALLAHEVAHLVRGDVRWLWVGRVMCTCCAFQPLNFLARRRWQQAAEYLCDDWAIERGVRALSLARCLTQVAEWRFGVDRPQIGLAAGGSKATLVGRVHRLVNEQPTRDAWQRPARRRLVSMSAAVAVVVIAGFTPRLALPLTFVGEDAIDANLNSIEALTDESAASDWHALEEELLQLEADLYRVEQLRVVANEPTEIAEGFQDLNRRTAPLRARRDCIASLLERESQR